MSQRLISKVAFGLVSGVMGAVVIVTSSVTAQQTVTGFNPATHVSQSTTERSAKVEACIRDLKAYRLTDDDVQKADKATVTCSKITSKRDAKALTKWIKGTKGNTHKWAYEIVG